MLITYTSKKGFFEPKRLTLHSNLKKGEKDGRKEKEKNRKEKEEIKAKQMNGISR